MTNVKTDAEKAHRKASLGSWLSGSQKKAPSYAVKSLNDDELEAEIAKAPEGPYRDALLAEQTHRNQED